MGLRIPRALGGPRKTFNQMNLRMLPVLSNSNRRIPIQVKTSLRMTSTPRKHRSHLLRADLRIPQALSSPTSSNLLQDGLEILPALSNRNSRSPSQMKMSL